MFKNVLLEELNMMPSSHAIIPCAVVNTYSFSFTREQTAQYEIKLKDDSDPREGKYAAKIEVAGQEFVGVGGSHKIAKLDAASQVLLEVFKIKYEPSLSLVVPKALAKAVKRPADDDATPGSETPGMT